MAEIKSVINSRHRKILNSVKLKFLEILKFVIIWFIVVVKMIARYFMYFNKFQEQIYFVCDVYSMSAVTVLHVDTIRSSR